MGTIVMVLIGTIAAFGAGSCSELCGEFLAARDPVAFWYRRIAIGFAIVSMILLFFAGRWL